MTTSPAHPPPVAGAEEPISSRNGQRRSTAPELAGTSRATAALTAYLDAVAAVMNRRGITVAGVQTTTEGQISGRIQLARQRTRWLRATIELRWSESTGSEAALRPSRGQPAMPWRYLHAERRQP